MSNTGPFHRLSIKCDVWLTDSWATRIFPGHPISWFCTTVIAVRAIPSTVNHLKETIVENYVIPVNQSTENDLLIIELDDRLEFSVISPANLCAQPDVNWLACNSKCTQNGSC